MPRKPATHEEIIERLTRYAGPEAARQIGEITQMLQEQRNREAIGRLAALDTDIGGFGIHTLREREKAGQRPYKNEDRPVYRPIQYVQMYLERSRDFDWHARHAAEMSCAHIEAQVKRLAEKRSFLKRFRNAPLGTMLHRNPIVKNSLPQSLWEDLDWLNSAIYVHVKHNYSLRQFMNPDEAEKERKGHLFSTEEAIAIYIIARHLAVGITEAI